jgi:low affinity Fe/Cu permease
VSLPNIQGGEATIIEGNLQELIRNKKEAAIIDVDSEDEEEDETVLQYCSDDANDNNDAMSPDDEDEDF